MGMEILTEIFYIRLRKREGPRGHGVITKVSA